LQAEALQAAQEAARAEAAANAPMSTWTWDAPPHSELQPQPVPAAAAAATGMYNRLLLTAAGLLWRPDTEAAGLGAVAGAAGEERRGSSTPARERRAAAARLWDAGALWARMQVRRAGLQHNTTPLAGGGRLTLGGGGRLTQEEAD
jgi:hypothetical protein